MHFTLYAFSEKKGQPVGITEVIVYGVEGAVKTAANYARAGIVLTDSRGRMVEPGWQPAL